MCSHGSGHKAPATAYVFSKFLDYIQSKSGVWLATYSEVAKWWQSRFGQGYRF